MSQRHLDRLTALDASFLHQEGPSTHMHVGGLAVFEGPAPALEDFLERLRQRLHLAPRFRHKLARTWLDGGRPAWVDDPTFALEYHVRHAALPAPGDAAQLRLLTGRIFSVPLDRAKPLWELWLVEGLDGGRFAIVSKTHHALIDGISGVDLATALFDAHPVPEPVRHSGRPWLARPEPSAAQLLADRMQGAVRSGLSAVLGAAEAAAHPDRAAGSLRDAAEGIAEVLWAGLNPAPATPLNVEIGPHRRFVGVSCRLEDFRRVRGAFGGTVNDVVLTVVTGALRALLQARGVRTEGLELRALVPVSVRAPEERHHLGNRLAALRAPLPVWIEDPLQRLRYVSRAMQQLKDGRQARGAELLAGANSLVARLSASARLFNLMVTNVPGPRAPLYVLGRELQQIYPLALLPERQALAVAAISYQEQLSFGLLGDQDALPDIELVAGGLRAGIGELASLADRVRPPAGGSDAAGDQPRPDRAGVGP
jgi:diacylglycerol O-acyltransferase / wax synthase